ncbi:hypothetical protein M514_28229 [Trichuris suis]|uniref:Uncharacterized protein n=1 Tax=Trichuris suis TaxID=68888 RepID=A0A085MQU8_9BILA|nr:hypothetical protein M514_28229 [Trichuris suis]
MQSVTNVELFVAPPITSNSQTEPDASKVRYDLVIPSAWTKDRHPYLCYSQPVKQNNKVRRSEFPLRTTNANRDA